MLDRRGFVKALAASITIAPAIEIAAAAPSSVTPIADATPTVEFAYSRLERFVNRILLEDLEKRGLFEVGPLQNSLEGSKSGPGGTFS